MNIRWQSASVGIAALAFGGLALAQDITGAGATFPAPLYAKWAADYHKATGAKINYQSVGSGAGIKQIDAKTVAFGASSRIECMLPRWSPSSWDRNTHFTSAGSTIDVTASSHCSRNSGAPVSTITGSSARITSVLTNT